MINVLKANFSYEFEQETSYLGYRAYPQQEGLIVVIPANYVDENVLSEQYVITTYLQQSGFQHIAVPVYSNDGKFIVAVNENKSVYLCYVYPLSDYVDYTTLPAFLQQFHHAGHPFPYTPIYANRYGKWKENWESILDQLDFLRQSFYEKEQLTNWERLWLECSFYFVGIGENAIQFLQESNEEKHFNHFDQPVFTLERASLLKEQTIIMPDQIVHDHPSRDLAEIIRGMILTDGKNSIREIVKLITEYHKERPFSTFGLRLLYARLLFPIHFIDYSQEVFTLPQERLNETDYLNQFLGYQREYEACLHQIHDEIYKQLQLELPTVEWLKAYEIN